MEVEEAAASSANRLLSHASPSAGDRERAAKLLEVAGKGGAAREQWARVGQELEARAGRAVERGDAGESVAWLHDAAEAFTRAGDEGAARRAAESALVQWPALERAKAIVVEPVAGGGPEPSRRLRRLPGARAEAEAAAAPDRPGAQRAELPAMFIEQKARLLELAGRAGEAQAAYGQLMEGYAREVARRRNEQQWQESLEAARSWLKAASRAGGRARLDQVRPEFVSLAREAAAEALTPEYFARGHDEVPARAMEEALLEAHALGNESFAAKYDEEMQAVLERTADVLEALKGRRTAAEALLSSEHEWPMVSARPGAKGRLLALAEEGRDLVAPMGLEGLARTHPLRAEVQDLAERLDDVLTHARRRAPEAFGRAAEHALERDPARALALANRAVSSGGKDVPVAALRARRAALARLARPEEAGAAHEAVLSALPQGPELEARRRLEEAQFQDERAEGQPSAVPDARAVVARSVREGAAALFARGEVARAKVRFEEAARLGDEESERWAKVAALSPAEPFQP